MAKYKRSIFIINPKFQYKVSLIICSLVLVGSLIYPLTIYDLFENFMKLNPSKTAELEQNRTNLLTLLIIIQICFLGLVFIGSIFISHKIAGPIFKLRRHLEELKSGSWSTDLYFRSGDYFPELAEDLNGLIEHYKQQRESDFSELEKISQLVENLSIIAPDDKKAVINEAMLKLHEIHSRTQANS